MKNHQRLLAAGLFCSFAPMAIAADDDASAVELEQMQITATREPEPADRVPASITIVTGAELRARGANDLRTALSLVAGVEGTPGGDGGPGGSVPALWGLREVDAFLLVVDGVPWGGAFNPQTAQVDLNNVERIEVLRGAAPVMYGATSFNGVIHIIHYAAGESPTLISAGGGSYGSVFGTGTTSLPAIGGFKQSIAATIEKRGFSVDREDFQRYHLLYRGGADLGFGRFRLDGDVTVLPQAPDNVTFRNGANLRTDLFSADVNHNPSDAKLDQDRFHLVAGLDVDAGIGEWGTTLSFTRTFDDIIRGFLRDYAPETGAEAGDEEKPDDFDADGYSQKRQFTDIYFDTHLTTKLGDAVTWTTGVDYLYGKGKQNAVNFGYFVSLDGEDAPAGSDQHADELVRSENERNFAGLYTQVDWRVLPSVDVLAGVRLNHTREETVGQETLNDEDQNDVQPENSDERTKTRVSGVVGATWTAFREGGNHLAVYADYRNTYKPLAVDFGPEAEVDILQPETSSSYEAGIKGAALDGRYEYNASVFQLDFRNLKTPDENGNNVNAGKTKFKGAEIEVRYTVIDNLKLAGSYSYHDSRFVEFRRGPGPSNIVNGNRFELSPYHLAAVGLLYTPPQGFNATFVGNYTGERKLNKSNSLSKGGFTTIDAGIGYNFGRVGLHVNGYNLTDRRDAIAESELSGEISGASSYYLLPSRRIIGSVSVALSYLSHG